MDETRKGNGMRNLLIFLMLMFVCAVAYAGTTSTNGYFYLPDVGATGSSEHTTWVNTQEATDAVIKSNTDHRNSSTQTHTNLVNSGYLEVGGSSGTRASGASGVGRWGGVGNTNNEGLKFDFEKDANHVEIASHTSASGLRVQGMGFEPSQVFSDPCGTYGKGAIFWNATSGYPCFCDLSGADVKMTDNSTACF